MRDDAVDRLGAQAALLDAEELTSWDTALARLDGPLAGPAVLSAPWRLLDDAGTTLATKVLITREAVSEPTYAGLVAAEGRLLATLSRVVATEIRRHLPDHRVATQPRRWSLDDLPGPALRYACSAASSEESDAL